LDPLSDGVECLVVVIDYRLGKSAVVDLKQLKKIGPYHVRVIGLVCVFCYFVHIFPSYEYTQVAEVRELILGEKHETVSLLASSGCPSRPVDEQLHFGWEIVVDNVVLRRALEGRELTKRGMSSPLAAMSVTIRN
jgi:hypothetical protein